MHDGLGDTLYVLLPVLAEGFGLSLVQVGLIRSAYKSAMALFQIPAGVLAERLDERLLLALGTAVVGGAFVGLGLSAGFLGLLTLLFVAGFGSAFQHPLSSAIVSAAYPAGGHRAALGTYNFAGDVGKFAFAAIASLLIAAGFPWRGTVALFGGLALAAAAAIPALLGAPGGTRGVSPRQRCAGDAPAAPGGTRGVSRATALREGAPPTGWGIRNPRGFAALSMIAVIDSSTRSAFLTFITFLMIAKGLPPDLASMTVPLVFVGGMAGKLACGFLAERIGIVRTVVITEIATGGGILMALALPNLAAFALLPAIGVALNGTSSVLYGTIGELVDAERRPRAFGLFYTLGSACGIAAPFACGLLGDAIGLHATIAIVGAVALLAVPLCLVLRPAVREAAAAG